MERKLIAAAVSSALALPMAAQAVEFSVSGHVNRAIMIVDGEDGPNDGELQHVDSNASETRFRFTGSEELDSGMTAGVNLELGRPGDWRTRHANVYLSSAGGTITIGQGSEATDNMAHARLGGPSWLGGVTNWCSYHSAAGGAACVSNDGNRNPVLRYDTPAIGPASISLSAGNNDFLDAMLKIAGSMGDAGYDIRIGHVSKYDKDVDAEPEKVTLVKGSDVKADEEDRLFAIGGDNDYGPVTVAEAMMMDNADTEYRKLTPPTAASTKEAGDITTMSAAVSFGQGTSVAVAWSQEDTGDENDYRYVELDHSYGAGSVGVYYKTGENGEGTDGSLWGVGIGHNLGGGATAYAGYRQMSEDGKDDVDLIVAGMRVTFN